MKYYAVKKGFHPGIYTSWDEASLEVKGYSNATYKSFNTLEEAEDFMKEKKISLPEHSLIAYVDGSFNNKKKCYGYGVVLIEGQEVIKQLYGKGDHEEYLSMRNVAGEIAGSEVAVKYAMEHHYEGIVIYYDYMGIEKWAKGEWKANKKGTQAYASFMQQASKTIKIEFMKVLAHSGDTYNELADSLAKKAVGL